MIIVEAIAIVIGGTIVINRGYIITSYIRHIYIILIIVNILYIFLYMNSKKIIKGLMLF
jgi:hypothetical protein